jgi:hypothetical protein
MQRIRGRHILRALADGFAGAVLASVGTVALISTAHAAAVTFNYTGSDVSYMISPGDYRITVYGARGGSASNDNLGGRGAEASAIYRFGQTQDLRIGVGGTAPDNDGGAGGGGASFVDFETGGDPGLTILLLVGGGGGGGYDNNFDNAFSSNGGDGKTTSTDPGANGAAGGGGGGGGYSTAGQSDPLGAQGGTNLSSGGAPGQQLSPGGFGGGGGGSGTASVTKFEGGGGGGGFNGGDAGFGGGTHFFASQGGTSFVEDNPPGCGPDHQGPACFLGGLVLAVGAGGNGQGLGNGSVIIEPITGLAVPEPPTFWLLMAAIPFIGLLRRGGWPHAGPRLANAPMPQSGAAGAAVHSRPNLEASCFR